jgi:hypothetical protein
MVKYYFAFFSFLIFVTNLWAAEVTVVGIGPARQTAVNDGLRQAVEQALGTFLDSKTSLSDGKVDFDKIITASSGYVKNYDVLAEGKDPIEEIFKVKMRVVVDDIKLKTALEEFLDDPRFQKVFQETRFDNKRIVVLYGRRTKQDLGPDEKAVQLIMDLVEDRLVGYGFRVFLPEQLKRIKGNINEMMIDEQTAIDLARQEDSDGVVLLNIDAGKRKTQDGFYVVHSSIMLKAYDVTTGELFANIHDRDKTISRGGSYGISDGVARVAEKIGAKAADGVVKKIVSRFSGQRSKFIVLVIQDAALSMQDQVEDLVIDDLGLKYRINRQSGSYLEMEIFSETDPTSFRRTLRRAFRKKGIKLNPKEIKGARIVYSGK